MRKVRAISITLVLMLMILAGCSSSGNGGNASGNSRGSSGGDVTLTIYTTTNDTAAQDTMKSITDAYTAEHPNVKFEWQFPANDYENILKMKMAGNDMPDIFDTHGWSKVRYNNFVADLRDQEWVPNLSESMKPIVTDDQGKVYALPLNAAKDGITYNKGILDQYGIEVPQTLDELIAAGEKIKKESNGEVTPFFFSSTDPASLAQYFDMMATPLLVSAEKNHAQELLDGTFDWNNWTLLPAKFKEMYDKGLMNEDVFTIRTSDRPQLFAEGKVAFSFSAPTFIPDALAINPDLKVGIMPLPSIVPGDTPTFSGGERYTMAAWKDGKNLDIAKDVINFFGKPENLKKIAEVTGTPSAMSNITPDLGIYTEYYEKYKDTRVFPYFDRVYLPSGMWDVMQTTSAEILSETMTPEESSQFYKQEVERLKSQQK
ncbi:ABC transporter substrate-binding protein [Paenibacillus sp. URB8-2]|uniref:ABC transporter substrate-binding protein n=1 Tax=Paenibacillus sp. URB8-2 TaxID=2741301 RepID=UPI0015C13B67|nr:extracellular solute-binding protein [Paenibacillus sp. URB8-2]BCG58218.1 putative binding protein MsmE [Paenibacillus sp. URB8-2]